MSRPANPSAPLRGCTECISRGMWQVITAQSAPQTSVHARRGGMLCRGLGGRGLGNGFTEHGGGGHTAADLSTGHLRIHHMARLHHKLAGLGPERPGRESTGKSMQQPLRSRAAAYYVQIRAPAKALSWDWPAAQLCNKSPSRWPEHAAAPASAWRGHPGRACPAATAGLCSQTS